MRKTERICQSTQRNVKHSDSRPGNRIETPSWNQSGSDISEFIARMKTGFELNNDGRVRTARAPRFNMMVCPSVYHCSFIERDERFEGTCTENFCQSN